MNEGGTAEERAMERDLVEVGWRERGGEGRGVVLPTVRAVFDATYLSASVGDVGPGAVSSRLHHDRRMSRRRRADSGRHFDGLLRALARMGYPREMPPSGAITDMFSPHRAPVRAAS